MTYNAAAEQRLWMRVNGNEWSAPADVRAMLDEIKRLHKMDAYWKQGDWVLATEHRKVEALAARYKAALELLREKRRALLAEEARVHGPGEVIHAGRCGREMNELLRAVDAAAALAEEPNG